jgi:hypothetical protein
MNQDNYDIYVSSGKYDQKVYLYLIPYFFLVLPFLCYFYVNALWHIPYPILHPVFLGAFLFLIFVTIGMFVITPGKVRSEGFGLVLGFIVGVVALYVSWSMWVSVVQVDLGKRVSVETYGYFGEETSVIYYLMHPHIAWRTVSMVSELGFWKVLTWLFWIVEAAGILLAGIFAGPNYAGIPFCEETGKWMKSVTLPKLTRPNDLEVFMTHLDTDVENISEILKIHPQDGTEQENATNLEVLLYTSHKKAHFVTITSNYAEVVGTHPSGADRLSFKSDIHADLKRISTETKEQLMSFAENESIAGDNES